MREPESSSPITTILWVIVLFAIGFGAVHCWSVKDWVALSTIGAVLIGGIAGYLWGMWRTLASSVGFYTGYALAEPTAARLIPYIENQWKQSIDRSTGLMISGFVAGAVVTLVLVVVGALLRRSETFKDCDHRAGFLLGLASTSLSVAMIFWVLLAAEPTIEQARRVIQSNPSLAQANDKQAIAIGKMSDLLAALKKSYVMTALSQWNPILEVDYLRQMKAEIESSITKPMNANQSGSGFALPSFINTAIPLGKAR